METESEQNSGSSSGSSSSGGSTRPQISQMSLYERQAVQVRHCYILGLSVQQRKGGEPFHVHLSCHASRWEHAGKSTGIQTCRDGSRKAKAQMELFFKVCFLLSWNMLVICYQVCSFFTCFVILIWWLCFFLWG